jgi:hypothetical protein
MKRQSKLTPRQEQNLGEQLSSQKAAHEFESVEAMMRHDALHTPVPPSIEARLQASIGSAPPPRPGWWRRLFGS